MWFVVRADVISIRAGRSFREPRHRHCSKCEKHLLQLKRVADNVWQVLAETLDNLNAWLFRS